MKMLLIRHGETDHNLENRMSGWTEASLSDHGREQAQILGHRLRNVPIKRVITSGMQRASETAALAFPAYVNRQAPEVMEGLKEMHFGAMEGLTMDEIQHSFPRDFALMMEKKGRYVFPQGESLRSFHQRIHRAAARLTRDPAPGLTAVVAHSGTIRCLLAGWIARDWRSHWRFRVDHCSLTLVTFFDGFPVLHTCNDTTHLDDPVSGTLS